MNEEQVSTAGNGQTVTVMESEDIRRALTRIAHEIVEKNQGAQDVALVGVLTRGVPLAERLAALLRQIENVDVPVGKLDIGLYRDDYGSQPAGNAALTPSSVPFDVTGKRMVLVDDVLFTGRSVRAAHFRPARSGTSRQHSTGRSAGQGPSRTAHPPGFCRQERSHRPPRTRQSDAARSGRRRPRPDPQARLDFNFRIRRMRHRNEASADAARNRRGRHPLSAGYRRRLQGDFGPPGQEGSHTAGPRHDHAVLREQHPDAHRPSRWPPKS